MSNGDAQQRNKVISNGSACTQPLTDKGLSIFDEEQIDGSSVLAIVISQECGDERIKGITDLDCRKVKSASIDFEKIPEAIEDEF